MGFLDAIGTVLDRVVPTTLSFVSGGPAAALTTAAGIERAKKNEKIMERSQMNPFELQSRNMRIQNQFDPQTIAGRPSFVTSLGQSIGDFGRDIGGFVQDIAPALNLFGIGGQPQRTNSGTASTIIRQRPDEEHHSVPTISC